MPFAGAARSDRRSPAAEHTAAAEIAEDGRMPVNFAHRQTPSARKSRIAARKAPGWTPLASAEATDRGRITDGRGYCTLARHFG
jgi:hypothetical protein